MCKKLLCILCIAIICNTVNAQCNYISASSTADETLSFNYAGGPLQSYGCEAIDPTFWLSEIENSVTVTFVNPESYPIFRVWGMNDDDIISITVNGINFPLNSKSAKYDSKVVCGVSPSSKGVKFSDGKLIGTAANKEGNFSYQNVQLNATNVNTITISRIGGKGFGIAGVSVGCAPMKGMRK